MLRFAVGGRSTALATPAVNDGIAQLWNPSSPPVTLYVREVLLNVAVNTVTAPLLWLKRSTTRGTAGSTITPDIDNCFSRMRAPPSVAVLDLANFSVEPTLDSPPLEVEISSSFGSSGFAFIYIAGLAIPPGTGLCWAARTTSAVEALDVSFVWDE